MRQPILIALCATLVLAQSDRLGEFTASSDIGAPPLKGSATYDPATRQYNVTGTGSDIWGQADQFHFLWREMSGNFAVTATIQFLTEGIAHRKAVIMLRKTLDADSPFLQLAIHGDGSAAMQMRNTKGDNTNTVDFPVEGPGVWKLKLVRQGATVTFWIARDGSPLRELGHTINPIGSPILLGLGVSSHSREALSTVLFSGVTVEPLIQEETLGLFTKSGDVGGPTLKGSTKYDPASGQYRLTGAGANIWGKQDQFQYVWKEMTGNFAITATVKFLGQGAAHRKAGIMLRQTLDTGAAYADVIVHGNGMPALQWRSKQGEDTNAFDLPFDSSGAFKLKLLRNGIRIFMYLSKEGEPLKEIAHTEVAFQGPVLAGLSVCSHQAGAADTVIFSDVIVETLAPPVPKAK